MAQTAYLTTAEGSFTYGVGDNWTSAMSLSAPGASTLSAPIPPLTSETDYATIAASSLPGAITSGAWTVTLVVGSGWESVTMRVRLERLLANGDLIQQGSNSGGHFGTPGTKVFAFESLDLGSFSATDRLRLVVLWENGSGVDVTRTVVLDLGAGGSRIDIPTTDTTGTAVFTTPLATSTSFAGATLTGSAASTVPLPVVVTGIPLHLTMRGTLKKAGGGQFEGSPIYSHGDMDVVYNEARDEVDAYFTSSGLSHSRKSLDVSDMVTDWSKTPEANPSQPEPQIAPNEANPFESLVNDAVGLVYHEALSRWFAYYEIQPGVLPEGQLGRVTALGCAWTDDDDALNRTWNKVATPVAVPTLPEEQGFIIGSELGKDIYRGGLSEASPDWDPVNQRIILFYRGLTWSGVGPYRWRMIRRLETLPSGPGSGNGIDFDAPQVVFDPVDETPIGQPGAETSGAHHFRVKRDPDTGLLHCVYMHGIGTSDHGFYHCVSADGGANFIRNTRNPILSVIDLVSQAGTQGEPAPGALTENVQNIIGGPVILFDPTGVDRFWMFHDGAQDTRYTETTDFYVYEASRIALGSAWGSAASSIPLPTQDATSAAATPGAGSTSVPAPSQSASAEAAHYGPAATSALIPTQEAFGTAMAPPNGTGAFSALVPTSSASGTLLTTHSGPVSFSVPLAAQTSTGSVNSDKTATASSQAPLAAQNAVGMVGGLLTAPATGPGWNLMTAYAYSQAAILALNPLGLYALTEFPNMEFTRPNPGTGAHFIKMWVDYGENEILGMGGCYRKRATLVIAVYEGVAFDPAAGPPGDKSLDIANDIHQAMFGAGHYLGVDFGIPAIVRIGRDGPWWVEEVQVPIYCDDMLVGAPRGTVDPNLDPESAHAVIKTRFGTEIHSAYGVPVHFAPEPYDPTPATSWVGVSITFINAATRQELAGQQVRSSERGLVVSTVFTHAEEGDVAGLAIADLIDAKFRDVSDRGVLFGTPTLRVVGRQQDFWLLNVSIPFQTNEVT